MCGFIAQVVPASTPLPPTARVVAALRHRGPDTQAVYETRSHGVAVRLVHARLKIIDLSDGAAQPMAAQGGALQLVFNGEVYRFDKLRADLLRLGHSFSTASDTEALLRALEQWGEGALERIEGMFAFALWDGRDGSLLMARDRLGIKPLYVATHDGGLVAGSEIRALLAAGVPFNVNEAGVASFLAFGSVTAPRTIMRCIEELRPGHLAVFRRGKLELRRYWTPPRPNRSPGTESLAASEVRTRLLASVKAQLVSDVPVGVFLSAGMDSTAIATCASELRDRNVDTFTVVFRGADAAWSEEIEATRFAARLGVRHHLIPVDESDALANIDSMMSALDQPSVDGPNSWVIARAVRGAGITVALSGLGGDEVFGGYGHLRSAALDERRDQVLSVLWPLVRTAAPLLTRVRGTHLRVDKALSIFAGLDRPEALYAARRALFPPQTFNELASEAITASRREGAAALLSPCDVAGRGRLDAQTVLELANYLSNTLLRDTDTMAMSHALEVRVPLLDESIVEYVIGLPSRWRVKRNVLKPLLSAAIPGIGTHSSSGKRGFVLPFANWLRSALRADVERRLRRLDYAGPFVRPPAVAALWRRFLAGDDRLWARVWAVYVLDRWIEINARR